MISAEGLRKTYIVKGKEIQVLRDLSFEIPRGEIAALLGPNGAGKTTIVRILSTLVRPTYGKATVNGYDVVEEEEKVRESIGLITEDKRSFYFRLTGLDNLIFFGAMQGLSLTECRTKAKEQLAALGLDSQKDIPYMKFSSGMKARLSLARALMRDPPVLLLDEPTLGIDLVSSRQIQQTLRSLAKSKTILIVGHNMSELDSLCHRILVLKNGLLVSQGTLEELRQRLGPIMEVTVPSLSRFDSVTRYVVARLAGSTILRIPRKDFEQLQLEHAEVSEKDPTLEDIYVDLVGISSTDVRQVSNGDRR